MNETTQQTAQRMLRRFGQKRAIEIAERWAALDSISSKDKADFAEIAKFLKHYAAYKKDRDGKQLTPERKTNESNISHQTRR